MTPIVDFWVPGLPGPGGSKRGIPFRRGNGSLGARLVDAGGKKTMIWRELVALYAGQAMGGKDPVDCAVEVHMHFYLPRPKGHFGSGRNRGIVKASAPVHHLQAADALKLARSTEDAMTTVVWRDDKTTVDLHVQKRWTPGQPGCRITVRPAPPPEPEPPGLRILTQGIAAIGGAPGLQ